jgi:hypothetical protein
LIGLSNGHADRLNRFEAFVRDDTQQRAEVARYTYDMTPATFEGEACSLTEIANMVTTVRDDLRQDVSAAEIWGAAVRALWRHRQIRRATQILPPLSMRLLSHIRVRRWLMKSRTLQRERTPLPRRQALQRAPRCSPKRPSLRIANGLAASKLMFSLRSNA